MNRRNHHLYMLVGFALVWGLGGLPGFADGPVRSALTRHDPLEADEQTTTLWRFGAMQDRTAPDLSGHELDGRLTDGVELVPVPHALPGFGRAARMVGNADDAQPHVVSDQAAQPLTEGPFTVEVRLRFQSGGGYWLQAGDRQSLLWGMMLRGAGYMRILGFANNAEGQATRFDLMTHTLLKPIGPVDYDRFYHYALSFDGQATFRVYVDGVLAWEARLPEGLTGVVLDKPSLRVGRPANWSSRFGGQVAEVRVSAAERVFEPAPRPLPPSLAAAAPNYRFDLGAADSPVEDHHLPVTLETRYTPERGYGWLEAPLADWDFWFAPGRYTSVPERSEAENSQGLLNGWQRDGLTVPDNATFRADIPPGAYAVRVTVGHPRRETQTQSIVVNGQPLGEHLKVMDIEGRPLTIRTSAKATTHQELRTARGVVTVGSDGLRVTVRGPDGEPVHVARIEATPWAEPLVQHVAGERALTWAGPGAAPAGFAAAAEAYAAARFEDAVAAAERLADPLVRATVWAWVLGYPNATSAADAELCRRIIATLQDYLVAQPGDLRAEALLDISRIFYAVIMVQLDRGSGVNHVFGSNNWRWMRDAAFLALEVTPREPFYGRARLLAGSLIYQAVEQAGGLSAPFQYVMPERHWPTPFPTVYFRAARDAFPEAPLARIYCGDNVPLDKQIEIPAGAPAWAALQHRALVRVMDVIHYWTDERQDAAGLMGGGLGDDVETLRWWSVGHLVADDERTREGWRKLADTAWRSTGGVGYWHATQISDVEHGAEPIGDPFPFLAFIDHGTDRFQQTLDRQRVVLDNVLQVWTGVTPDGFRMFKSTHYSATTVSDRGGDHFYNIRAANPALFRTWFTGDPEAQQFIVDWAESWRDAILAERDGKPAGIWPIIVTWPERRFIMRADRPWYNPGYFAYPGGNPIYNVLIAAYEITGQDHFLDPQRKLLELMAQVGVQGAGFEAGAEGGSRIASQYRARRATDVKSAFEQGSLEWALWTGHANVGLIGARYRLVSGDRRFDEVLAQYAPPMDRTRIAYDRAETPAARREALAPILEHLEEVLSRLDYNWPLRTSEPKSTDRVWVPGTEEIIAMATGTATLGGARGAERQWPLFGVAWKNTGTDVAMYVMENWPDRLNGYLYNFTEQPRTIGAQVWRLKPGTYRFHLEAVEDFGEDAGTRLEERTVTLEKKGQIIEFEIPARQQVRFAIAPR